MTLYTHTDRQSTERGRAVPTTTTTTHGSRDWRGEKNKIEKKNNKRGDNSCTSPSWRPKSIIIT